MSKHTPGPWQEKHWDGNNQITITAVAMRGPNVLALTRPPMTSVMDKDGNPTFECRSADVDEAEANANLIAAAPELLDACIMALEAEEFRLGKRGRGWDRAFMVERLSAAIAKAEGR